ncbi:MAG: DUF4382 domain-containing protein [Aquificaceae bacterium]
MKKGVLVTALAIGTVFSCGGGGGGSGSYSAGGGTSLPLYLTDDASVYPSITVTLYEVNLCSDAQCVQKVNLFSSQQGVEVDLAKLNGVLQYIGNVSVPQGTYNRLELVFDKSLTINDQWGNTHNAEFTPMQEQPNKPNTVQCATNTNKCYIRFNGTVNPFADGRLVIDFDLKEFEVNTNSNPWQVTEVKVKPLTKSEMSGTLYTHKIYMTVQGVSGNTITGQWMGRTYTVNVNPGTVCEINHVYTTNCVAQIQTGMCIEVKVQGDPAVSTTLDAIKIENENSKKCMTSSGSDPPTDGYIKLKGSVTGKGSSDFTINTYSNPIKVTQGTYCEYQKHVYMTGSACFDNLQTGWFVEVKVNANGEAIKIEKEY